jgi:hypothetical protein
MDLKLTDGDIDVSTGDFQLIDGTEAIAQHISIRLQLFKGEWFLDTRLGIPYFQSILVKNPGSNVIRAIYTEALLETPGVLAVNDLEVTYDGELRKVAITFSALVTESEEPLNFTQEFIIS